MEVDRNVNLHFFLYAPTVGEGDYFFFEDFFAVASNMTGVPIMMEA